MKLVIQIPCRDEEAYLAATVADLPQQLSGIASIQLVVIDDGSHDGTAALAARLGATVVRLHDHRGLARAFMAGLEASLMLGADIIVNTDADNQYRGDDIALLVEPILAGRADLVVGTRPISEIAAFSWSKKLLQHLGSWTVRRLSGTRVADATSGFRAMTRQTAFQLNVFSRYTYTLETIVHAAQCGLRVVSVPVRVNGAVRASRLAPSTSSYIWRTGSGLIRAFVVYRPFRSFVIPALLLFASALALGVRFLYFHITDGGLTGHVQSLILAAILFGFSGFLMIVAFLGDLIAMNRRLLEEMLVDARRRRFDSVLHKTDE